MKLVGAMFLLLSLQQWVFPIIPFQGIGTTQAEEVYSFIKSILFMANKRDNHNLISQENVAPDFLSSSFSVYVGEPEGLREADKISGLPEQPPGVDFDQYSGYVTVDPKAGRSLFYYLAESPHCPSAKPLVLWLAGGPGSSSLGYGSFLQIGPFKVHSDGKTLYMNDYSWNKVANVLFLESPAGVGFSYSNTTSDYNTTDDKRTTADAYSFLVNWLQRFPQYKNRDLYLSGVSYGGRFVSELAYTILLHNKNPTLPFINLKNIAIGNPVLDFRLASKGNLEYLWAHGMISDATHEAITKYCDFETGNYPDKCKEYISKANYEAGPVFRDNIYSYECTTTTRNPSSKPQSPPVSGFDECSRYYVETYLNRRNVQEALHAIDTNWTISSKYVGRGNWKNMPVTVLPILKHLIANKVHIWILSGDLDAIMSVTTTRLAISSMKLPVVTAWRPWLSDHTLQEVGGYVEGYEGLTLVTIRGAGHEFASYQPQRSLAVISSILIGELPPHI